MGKGQVQVSKREIHTHIYLDQTKVEFIYIFFNFIFEPPLLKMLGPPSYNFMLIDFIVIAFALVVNSI